MMSDNSSNIVAPQLEECVLVYNPEESDSDKISTKLSSTITETVGNASPCKVTRVSRTSTEEEKLRVKQSLHHTNVCVVFVITEEILESEARTFLDGMVEAANVSGLDSPMILTVYYKVSLENIPQPLRVNDMLDYEVPSFRIELGKVIDEWLSPSKNAAMKFHIPDPSTFRIACIIMVEVHAMKGSGKQKQNKSADLKVIREAIYTILMDPGKSLSQVLLDTYSLIVRDVSQSPLKIISKVKDDEMWIRVQAACDDRSLGALFMQHVRVFLNRDLQYEIKLIPQRDSTPSDTAASPVDGIVTNIIFDVIKKKEFTTYDFYQKLSSYRDKADLRALRSDPDGYNPLHAILVYNRLPLMLPLVQLKLFTIYLHETVPISSPSSFRGHTPRQLAESKKARRFKDALSEHERLVHSMGKFLKACHDADVALVRRMIHSQRQLLQERDSFRNNCLYWALVSNNLELFVMLLDNKADYNNLNESKESLLHVACMLGHHKFIDTLMTRCRLDVTAACANKRTPLERVAENGHIECLKELLKHRVSLTACVLPYAAANDRLRFIK